MGYRLLPLLFVSLMLGACASTPQLNSEGVDTGLVPSQSTETLDLANGRLVHWGGVIVASRNLAGESQLEILAYPLTGKGRPNTEEKPLGRFLAVKKGYLETLDYSAGKTVSIVGRLQPSRPGKIGEAEYRYPVVQIEQIALWRPASYSQPQFHIGIGIGIHN
ncbi:MAG: Slp family lipoprotein [Gammaproteobacteria bacterium]